MKFLFLIISLLSFSVFSQEENFIDFVLFRNSTVVGEAADFKVAKVKIQREIYKRFIEEDLVLMCKTTTDTDATLALRNGTAFSMHKKAKPEKRWTYISANSFDGLHNVEAINELVENNLKVNTYFIGSVHEYNDYLKKWSLMHVQDAASISYVKIYDPKIHTTSTVPVTNSFYCFVKNQKNELISL